MQIGPYVPITQQQNEWMIGSSSVYRAYNNGGERIMLQSYPLTSSCEFLYTYDSYYSGSSTNNTWYDLSGKNRHISTPVLKPQNDTSYGGGYQFDYSGDYYTSLPTSSIASSSAYTICMYFQGTNATDNQDGTLIGQGSSNWYVRRINTTSLNRIIYDGAGAAITMNTSGDYCFFALSVESGQVHLFTGYSGGAFIDEGTFAGTVYSYGSTDTTYLAAGGVNFWNHGIGSVGIWSGNLTYTEAEKVFNNFRRISL